MAKQACLGLKFRGVKNCVCGKSALFRFSIFFFNFYPKNACYPMISSDEIHPHGMKEKCENICLG